MSLVRIEDTPLFMGLQVWYWADVVGVRHFAWFFSLGEIKVRSRETVVLLGMADMISLFPGDSLEISRREP